MINEIKKEAQERMGKTLKRWAMPSRRFVPVARIRASWIA